MTEIDRIARGLTMHRDEMVRKAVEACENDPFVDDVRYQGTTQQGARFEHYVNVTLAALEASGLAVVQGWQGIESAPRDAGVWLLGTDGTKVSPMCWMIKCDDDLYTGWCGATPVDGGILYCDHVQLGFVPTHWMPLPSPPLAAASDGGRG